MPPGGTARSRDGPCAAGRDYRPPIEPPAAWLSTAFRIWRGAPMPAVPRPGVSALSAHPQLSPTAGSDRPGYRSPAEAAPQAGSPGVDRVGWGFIALYTLAYLSTCLVFIAPLLVTLALKEN